MVIKANKANGSLICSILPTPTTDESLMCSGANLPSASFARAVERANFNSAPATSDDRIESQRPTSSGTAKIPPPLKFLNKSHVILAAQSVTIPDVGHVAGTQIIRFGNGMEWITEYETAPLQSRSKSILPCILGGILEGPLLLATGDAPRNSPFDRDTDLYEFYQNCTTVTVIVDQEMTDNARNLATTWRINALFIVQVTVGKDRETSDITALLESLNINAVTALAGPQSLILAQVGNRYYFYRGIANCDCFHTVGMDFGHDVTSLLENIDLGTLIIPQWPRLIRLSDTNKVFLSKAKRGMLPDELQGIFEKSSLTEIESLRDDILSIVPQLQALMKQKEIEDFCSKLLSDVHAKVVDSTATQKKAYLNFFTHEYKSGDMASKKKKDQLLSALRHATKESQSSIAWLTHTLGNLVSSQNTSTKKHDLKRMLRQSAIRGNVEFVKSMTFDSLAGLLEDYAEEMGVLVVNVDSDSYRQLLSNPDSAMVSASNCCTLDSRILYLEGLDAGIVLEQSQKKHTGPLVSQLGPNQPILALPYLTEQENTGSMLAWVCWDEFVSLEDPSLIRWVEKCNEPHIASLRILMRGTLSTAMSSRECNMVPASEETGQLMGALLMASMASLAQIKITSPTPSVEAADTVTRLMRGLYGHLLTVAGSGVKPLSFVWQLMGNNPSLDVPTSIRSWTWYQNVSSLFPFTGWTAENLNLNLERLLDKVIFRMITHSKLPALDPSNLKRREKSLKACNLQLAHSRTLLIALMKILAPRADSQRMAQNLLLVLPKPTGNKKSSYRKLYSYVERLSKGGKLWPWGNLVAANLFTRRSATFQDLKRELCVAIDGEDKAEIQKLYEKILDKRKGIAFTWQLEPEAVNVQCLKNIRNMVGMLASHEMSQIRKNRPIFMAVKGDAEQWRIPWQVGSSELGTLAPLDVDALTKVLNGTAYPGVDIFSATVAVTVSEKSAGTDGWNQFEGLVRPEFLKRIRRVSDSDEVCEMLKLPRSMMKSFISALAPDFEDRDLPNTFKECVFELLKNPNQETATPTKQLFKRLAIQGA